MMFLRIQGSRSFLVKWEGFRKAIHNTWVDEIDILDKSLITAFEEATVKKGKHTNVPPFGPSVHVAVKYALTQPRGEKQRGMMKTLHLYQDQLTLWHHVQIKRSKKRCRTPRRERKTRSGALNGTRGKRAIRSARSRRVPSGQCTSAA